MPVQALPWDEAAARTAIANLVEDATGVTCVREHQGGPAPTMPYTSYKVLAGPTPLFGLSPGDLSYDSGEDDILIQSGGQSLLTVSMQAYDDAGAARAYLDRVAARLASTTGKEALDVAGLALVRYPDVSDISALIGATQASRATMTASFAVVLDIEDRVTYINQAEITTDINNPDGSDAIDSSQTVTGPA